MLNSSSLKSSLGCTSTRLSRISPTVSASCDTCKLADGTLDHLFWFSGFSVSLGYWVASMLWLYPSVTTSSYVGYSKSNYSNWKFILSCEHCRLQIRFMVRVDRYMHAFSVMWQFIFYIQLHLHLFVSCVCLLQIDHKIIKS